MVKEEKKYDVVDAAITRLKCMHSLISDCFLVTNTTKDLGQKAKEVRTFIYKFSQDEYFKAENGEEILTEMLQK